MTNTEDQYITAIRRGDAEGLRRIYREFLPKVARLVTKNGGTYDDAKDVFQDALLVLYEKSRRDGFVLTSSFFTLLYGVSRNLWGNRLQKRSRGEVTLSDAVKSRVKADMDVELIEAERNRIFWDAFRRLGADCRRLLQLFFQKMSMAEIAEAMGFSSVGYAKKRKFQCKEYLLGQIKADDRYQDYLT